MSLQQGKQIQGIGALWLTRVGTAGSPQFRFHTALPCRWEESAAVSSPAGGSLCPSEILNILLIRNEARLAFWDNRCLSNVLRRQETVGAWSSSVIPVRSAGWSHGQRGHVWRGYVNGDYNMGTATRSFGSFKRTLSESLAFVEDNVDWEDR